MESLNIYQGCANYSYAPFFCSSYYPAFNYCYQTYFQNPPFAYPQASYPFYPESDRPEAHSPSFLATDSQTHQLPEIPPQLDSEAEKKCGREGGAKRRSGRAGARSQAEQKENRNVYSNILRNFFRKVNDPVRIERLVGRIIAKNRLGVTSQEFHDHVRCLRVNHGKYLRFKKLRPLFVDVDAPEHALIFRALFEYMAEGELLAQALTSRKIGRWSIVLHLRGARELKERLYH